MARQLNFYKDAQCFRDLLRKAAEQPRRAALCSAHTFDRRSILGEGAEV